MERVRNINMSNEKQMPLPLLQFSLKSKAIKKITPKSWTVPMKKNGKKVVSRIPLNKLK